MNSKTYQTEILIVGAGPAGLALACLLTKYHVPLIIIDKKTGIIDQIKACLLSSRSLEVFDDLSLSDRALAWGQKTLAFDIYNDNEFAAHLPYYSIETRFPLNLHLGQPYTEKILNDYLSNQRIDVLWEHKLTAITQNETGATAIILHDSTEKIIHAKYIVGADGASSKTRTLCNISFEGNTYPTHYLLGNVKLTWELSHDVARLFLGKFGFLSLYPLPNNMMQIGGNITAQSERAASAKLKILMALFDERCPFPGKLSDLKWISYYRSHCYHVKKYVSNRVILIGDAALIVSPLTGLGMNSGIQDAFNLAWKLALIYKKQADEKLLLSYQQERYFLSKKLSSFSNVLEASYTLNKPFSQSLREHMMSYTKKSKAAQQQEVARLMQKNLSYQSCSLFQDNAIPKGALRAGMQTADLSFLKNKKNSFFILLLFSGFNENTEIEESLFMLSENHKIKSIMSVYYIQTTQKTIYDNIKQVTVINDVSHRVHNSYGISVPSLYLIRPDDYIAYCTTNPSQKALLGYLQEFLCVSLQ